jgi:hypothetical protein
VEDGLREKQGPESGRSGWGGTVVTEGNEVSEGKIRRRAMDRMGRHGERYAFVRVVRRRRIRDKTPEELELLPTGDPKTI